jgi:hypothetical protein
LLKNEKIPALWAGKELYIWNYRDERKKPAQEKRKKIIK